MKVSPIEGVFEVDANGRSRMRESRVLVREHMQHVYNRHNSCGAGTRSY